MSAVVPDSVQTLVVDVLVPVLACPVSSVVLVLDETAVVSELVLLAASAAATDNVMVTAVFAEQAVVVVAAVVSGLVVWVHHVWSVHRDRLLQFSSFLASLVLRVMPCVAVSFAHLIAVARCDTQTFPPGIPMTRAGPSH